MKKIILLLIVLTLMGCIGCDSEESSYDDSQSSQITSEDNALNSKEEVENNVAGEDLLSENIPCDEILNAPLSAGFIQVDNYLFKVDGMYTMADVMNTLNRSGEEYVFYEYSDEVLSLDDYAGDTQSLGVSKLENKTNSYFHVAISNDFEEQTTPTYGENIIEKFTLYGNYYCLANGFTSEFNISEEELQAYFQKEGLIEDNTYYPKKKNSYERRERDGIPFYNAYVVSESNPDTVLFYQFVYKSKNTLSSCRIELDHASSYGD